MTRSAIRSTALTFLAAVATAALFLPGCDNPACAFGGTCVGSSITGALGTEGASVPAEGEQILGAAPTVVNMFPTGMTADTDSPIVIVFSESMATDKLSTAFELKGTMVAGAIPTVATLIGDGHMVVLFPATLQPEDTYTVSFRENVVFADRTGQAVVPSANRAIGSFTTAATNGDDPVLVATWPMTGATNQSPTTEIDAVFSQSVEPTTVDNMSWVVTVNGSAPTQNPVAQPISLAGGLATDNRVYRWRSIGPTGEFESLGTNANVRLELSPAGHAIEAVLPPGLVANGVITFTTLPFSAPTAAAITSEPVDAIGIAQISGPSDLAIAVDLDAAQAGDKVGVFMFGKEPQPNPPVPVENLRTIAFQREVPVEAPFTTFTFTAQELDLVRTTAPLGARFADGTVAFAFYVKRGNAVSPIKLLDVDSVKNGTQSPTLDTVAPVLFGLSTSGNVVTSFRSDERDLVLVGRASEPLRAALVTTPASDNVVDPGELPAVTGSNASGLFIAAPVRVGVLAAGTPPVPYTLTIYDSALNSATAVHGRFLQVGQAANGSRMGLFSDIKVEVIDATTLLPVSGATVYVHENLDGFTSFVASGVTDGMGHVTLAPALLGESIVTVDATSQAYELFTFDGIPTESVSIPLRKNSIVAAHVSGTVSTTDANFTVYQKNVADTRFTTPGETVVQAGSCSVSQQAQALLCTFGSPPIPIRANEIGAQSAVAVLVPSNPFAYSALTFLKGFSLTLPMAPVTDTSVTQTNTLVMGTSLDASTLDAEERPIDVNPAALSTLNWPGITASNKPRVRVEGVSPGLPYDVTVGSGIAFNDSLPPDTWGVRAAYPGSVDGIANLGGDQLGRYVKSQTIDADLLLRVEVVDAAGNRGGVRPRLSMLTPTLLAPAAPTPGVAPFAFNLDTLDFSFPDVLTDAAGEGGLYRVRLTDQTGFSWTIWRLDAPDSAGPDATVHLPLIGLGGTLPLTRGDLDAQISAFAWPTFDPASFMWADVEREFDQFAHTTTVTVMPP